MTFKFIVDYNAGKLVKWLRLMGYDAVLFTGGDDRKLIASALNDSRVILTRDTGVMKFGLVISGKIQALNINSEKPDEQIRQVVAVFLLDPKSGLFSRCLECNGLLQRRSKEWAKGRVPPRVFEIRDEYFECPNCGRIYWKGTHWEQMTKRLEELAA